MSGVEEMADAAEAARNGEQRSGTERVVLRGVRALVLDDLPGETRDAVLQAVGGDHRAVVVDAWTAVAAASGDVAAAIKSYSGQSGAPDARPGKYKAVPHGSWFVAPLVIEAPLS